MSYENSKIYQIVCRESRLCYIGSTTQNLKTRLNCHKHSCDAKIRKESSYIVIENNNYYIELIEEYPCKTRKELHKREGYWQRHFPCVNKRIEGRTSRQWYIDNKTRIDKYQKTYMNENEESLIEYRKEYYQKNKDKIKERIYERSKLDRVRIKNNELKRLRYIDNKKDILLKKKEKIKCDNCGSTVNKSNISYHKKSKKCIKFGK